MTKTGRKEELGYLLAVVVIQTAMVALVPHQWGVVLPLIAVPLASRAGVRFGTGLRTIRAILFITVPVLIVRLITDPSIATALEWSDYAARLVAAALVAVAYLAHRGARGVQRALTAVVSLVPGSAGRAAGDVVRSALFLLPEVFRRMKESHGAAMIRFRRGRSGSPRRITIAVSRATIVSVSSVPQRRAEAMIVRGVIS